MLHQDGPVLVASNHMGQRKLTMAHMFPHHRENMQIGANLCLRAAIQG